MDYSGTPPGRSGIGWRYLDRARDFATAGGMDEDRGSDEPEAGSLAGVPGSVAGAARLRIVLTGAGTSAFIGECLAPALKLRTSLRVDAVATTDLVGSPDAWLERGVPTLLVSFRTVRQQSGKPGSARSGRAGVRDLSSPDRDL